MEQNNSFMPSQLPETPRNNKKIIFVVSIIALIVIGFAVWVLAFGGKNIIGIGQKKPVSQISDLSEICQIHTEYCKDKEFLNSFTFIQPIHPDIDEKEVYSNVIVKVKDRNTNPHIEFYKKTGEHINIPPLNQVGSISYANDTSILVEVGEDEAPSQFYYYDGTEWKNIWSSLLLDEYIKKFYFSKKPIDYHLALSQNGILKMDEESFYTREYGAFDDQKDGERLGTIGHYTFLFDIKNKNLLAVYIGNDSLNDRVLKLEENTNLFAGFLSGQFGTEKNNEVDMCKLHPEYCNDELPNIPTNIKPVFISKSKVESVLKSCFPYGNCGTQQNQLEKIISPDVKAVVKMKEGAKISDENIISLEFQNAHTGAKLNIPSFSDVGYIYYLNDKNILISSTDNPLDTDGSYSQPISKYYFYDGTKWQSLSFVYDLVKNLYFSQKLGNGDFLYSRNMGGKDITTNGFIFDADEWYPNPEVQKEILNDSKDINRLNLIGSYRFWIDLKNKKLTGVYIGNDNLKSNISKIKEVTQSFLGLIK